MNKSSCCFDKLTCCFGVVLFAVLTCGIAKASSSVDLAWDGNPDPSVVGYNVYYGGASGDYTNVISVGDVTNANIGGLTEGKTYYFAVTAYDSYGDESAFSAETIYIVPGWLNLTPGTIASGTAEIQFPVAPGHLYQLQESPDMRNWSTIWQTTGVSNEWVTYDAPVGTSGSMFYRVVSD